MTIHTATARSLSQYYTVPQVAADYIARVLARYIDKPFSTIIEPSAGTGAFSSWLGSECIALDLDPKAPGIQKADFLDWTFPGSDGRCLVIGNPPFGAKAALGFLNHAAKFADVIAFILPATFCKKTQQNRVARNLHLVHEERVTQDAFLFQGKTVDVPCVFQIWERRPELRPLHKVVTTHPDFERCSQEEADLVIRRVGAHAGQIKSNEAQWSAESNIFLRATGCSSEVLKERFSRLEMAELARNGAGGGSINMSEIVALYEAARKKGIRQSAGRNDAAETVWDETVSWAGPADMAVPVVIQDVQGDTTTDLAMHERHSLSPCREKIRKSILAVR